jgi:hypothetical protein
MTSKTRQNTPTEQNKEDNGLILYRLDKVEAAVREVSTKLDKQDTIKRSDLKDFQETIVTRFLDMRADLQKQLDSKASNSDLQDFKKVVYSVLGLAQAITLAFLGFLLSKV